jgi:hypothetical protein
VAGRRRSILELCFFASCFFPIASALDAESIAYTYDARGRLVKVARSGSVNNGVSACYGYDRGDNRSSVTVSTASNCSNPPPSFSINDVAVTEGGNLVLTVAKSGMTSSSFSVDYATANGTATAGSDYTATTGTLTFAAADTTKTITIATTNDTTVEGDETVLVSLSGATGGASMSDAQGIGTINDNDSAANCSGVSYSVNDVSKVEGGILVFTITKAGSTSSSCSVSYATADGTATAPTYYTATSGTLTFASAQTSNTVPVTTFNLGRSLGIRTMLLNLSSPTAGASISDAQGKGSITASGGGFEPCYDANGGRIPCP